MQFYLTSLRGKDYFAKKLEPGVFGPLEPEPLEIKYQEPEPEPEPLGKKNQEPEPEPLEKKSGAGAAKKFAGSPALVTKLLFNFVQT